MSEPKVTLAQWKERVAKNAGSNTGTTNPQPTTNGVHGNNGTAGSANGKSATGSSGNPLHPDPSEELARVRETVLVLKKQIYGSSVPGEVGMVRHIMDLEERLTAITNTNLALMNRLGKIEAKFSELLAVLEIEEEDGQAQ